MDFSGLKLKFGSETTQDPMGDPVRVLCYGDPKTRKTWWAGTAGETHNVFAMDGERGLGILRHLPDTALANINQIPLAINPDPAANNMLMFLTLMFEKQTFIYSYKLNRDISIANAVKSPDETFLVVDLSRMTKDDVMIIDSWTQLVKDCQTQYQRDNGIDPFEGLLHAKDEKNKYSYFGYANLVLDNVLQGINKLPCHVIMTAHQDIYTHEFKVGALTQKVSKIQLLSSSGAQASKVPGVMGDVLWFKHDKDAKSSKIDVRPSENRISGGRRLGLNVYDFDGTMDSWTFKDYCEEAQVSHGKIRGPEEMPPIFRATGKQIDELNNGG